MHLVEVIEGSEPARASAKAAEPLGLCSAEQMWKRIAKVDLERARRELSETQRDVLVSSWHGPYERMRNFDKLAADLGIHKALWSAGLPYQFQGVLLAPTTKRTRAALDRLGLIEDTTTAEARYGRAPKVWPACADPLSESGELVAGALATAPARAISGPQRDGLLLSVHYRARWNELISTHG